MHNPNEGMLPLERERLNEGNPKHLDSLQHRPLVTHNSGYYHFDLFLKHSITLCEKLYVTKPPGLGELCTRVRINSNKIILRGNKRESYWREREKDDGI